MKFAAAVLCAVGVASAQGGPPPPGGGNTTVTYNATYTLNGGTASQSNQTYSASATDTSGVWVTNSGALTLLNPTITTSGNTSSTDNSSFAGLNAALLVTSGSANVTGGTIATTGTGANGAFAYDTGSALSLTNTTITASGDGGHALMATGGASLTAANVNMTTTGGSASAVATDRGGGTITVTGGIVTTGGNNSADIYSTGSITVTGATMKATGAETAVIEGANSITLNNTTLATTKDKWGVMIYQSMSGDATGTQGTFTMTGGSLTSTGATGPLFYVNNSTGVINLKGVTLSAASGVLVSAAAGAWGNTGSNGGHVVLTADGQTLPGDMIADSISTIAVTLKNNSTLTGKLSKASLSLDGTSLWSVTANSVLAALTDAAGISGGSITNIKGNGYTVTYDSSLSANTYLGGKTYSLAGSGSLTPASGTSAAASAPAITAAGVSNAASGVAGAAPGAWISIYGSNLSAAAAAATAADLVNGYLPTTLGGTTVTIDGKPAYLNYVSPMQLNLQAPNFSTTGSVTVTVANSSGSSSASVTAQAVMPGLFTASNYVLAARPVDGVIINGTGAAAKPGDVLEIFATGLGATATVVSPGLVFSGAYPTTATPAVAIGGTNAAVLYAGLIGAGLYQINLAVPAGLATGTYPVVVTQSGANSPSTALLKIVAE